MTSTVAPPPSDASSAPEPPQALGGPNAIVIVLSFAGIVAALMQTLVVPIIGDLPELFDTSASNAAWVITATLLASAVAVPVSGRLGDLFGKRRIMVICSGILIVGSLVAALATNVEMMITGRALQGMAMGLVPLGISAMRDLLPQEKLGSAVALMSASMGIGGALGLPIAAAIAEYGNWHALFWASFGLSIAVAVLIFLLVPATPVTAQGKFDPIGAVGLGVGLICLLLGVSKGADWGGAARRPSACSSRLRSSSSSGESSSSAPTTRWSISASPRDPSYSSPTLRRWWSASRCMPPTSSSRSCCSCLRRPATASARTCSTWACG
ncbi:MFS transporter [Nocardioides alcanivorans]|uniref:MFS transporter n=1 Tax=Nocardioides alcanivorans TaxID=2897352 RepID=UPI001F27F95D|nr:MFS transporter [Nocardioides alcanivorans]